MNLVLLQPALRVSQDEWNLSLMRGLLDKVAPILTSKDIILLPEHALFTHSAKVYEHAISELAGEYGCTIVGGSHHEHRSDGAVNAGAVAVPGDGVIFRYTKQRPYFHESHMVKPGHFHGLLELHGLRILILICADFFFGDWFAKLRHPPDLVLAPAFSVSRKPDPEFSRAIWMHTAVARAYEHGCHVGISDWDHGSTVPMFSTSGVAGFADPTREDPVHLFHRVPTGGIWVAHPDFQRLRSFREDRAERGFFAYRDPDPKA